MLKGKTVVLGVCGGIAAYKAVEVVSRLVKLGVEVHVVMTPAATQFVTPLTFREISSHPVYTNLWEEPKLWNVEHIALARRADLFVVAPASANMIGKLANGIADDFLSTTIMATPAPVMIVPAMNTNMYLNLATQQNLATLKNRRMQVLEPSSGMLACGTEGIGRLPEPVEIVSRIQDHFLHAGSLYGLKILVTAGGTREAIDPVRFIGNRSSGKMGYAIATAAAERGAQVTLVSGPVVLQAPNGVKLISVESASQMREAVLANFSETDIVIKAAAVADYRPEAAAEQKIKKTSDPMTLVLIKNPDILAELGALKTTQFLVGFAAETQDLIAHATEKLHKKNLDMLIANDVTLHGAGFDADTNIIKILSRDGTIEEFPQLSKKELGNVILDKIIARRTILSIDAIKK
jgi:phosphopantothenoylcysteine decarboxylase / phosphopantothenate---cysteine ligase